MWLPVSPARALLLRVLLAAPLAFATACGAQSQPASLATGSPYDVPRVELLLNGDWLRAPAGSDANTPPVRGFRTVRVPEFYLDAARDAAWFRLEFWVPAGLAAPGRELALRFDRVRHRARVFANGRFVGEHFGSRAGFELDATAALRPGAVNVLEVRVDSCRGVNVRPEGAVDDPETEARFCPQRAQRDFATIAGDVWLAARPALRVDSVAVETSVQEHRIAVRTTLVNHDTRPRSVRVSNQVRHDADVVLALPDATVEVAPGGVRSVRAELPWPAPRLWGPPPYGEGALHSLDTRVVAEGAEVDRLTTRFGFRELWARGDRLLLNGREIRVLALWLAEGSGPTLWSLRVAAVQAAGANAVHNHTEQGDAGFYDAADEASLLVWDGNFCGGPAGSSEHVSLAPFPELQSFLAAEYRDWARAVQNHPSVVLLQAACLLNVEQAGQLARVYREVDTTRVIHGSGIPDTPLPSGEFEPLPALVSYVDVTGPDPAADLRRVLASAPPATTPRIFREIYQRDPFAPGVRRGDVAKATARAIDFLAGSDVRAFMLTGTLVFVLGYDDGPPRWPSRSGRGPLTRGRVAAGGLWEIVNLSEPQRPAFALSPDAGVQVEAMRRFVRHPIAPVTQRRPDVLVRVTRDGRPVPDTFVMLQSLDVATAPLRGGRSDAAGVAWLTAVQAGRHRVVVPDQGAFRSIDIDLPVAHLDLAHGGVPQSREVEIALPPDATR